MKRIHFLLLLPLACTGCGPSSWLNGFLDPTQQGNFHDNSRVTEIQQTISFRDTPQGIAGAVDPTPDDLIQTVEEYKLGVGDTVSISMLDFLQRDFESKFELTVDELGFINVTLLGEIYVQGMTQRMLRSELIQMGKRERIYRPESDPSVVVTFLSQQLRTYNITGAIQAPNRYRIVPPDFRLRDAINQAGGLDASVKTIYVFQNEPKPKKVIEHGVHEKTPAFPDAADTPLPPVAPMAMSEQASGPNPPPTPPTRAATVPASVPAKTPPPSNANNEKELIDAISPPDKPADERKPETTAPQQAPPATTAPTLPPFIFVNDRFVESPTTPTQGAPVVTPSPTSQPGVATSQKSLDWQDLTTEGQHRIVRIPAEKLRNGDSNYNIVIHHDDWIYIDPGQVGVFYLDGHFARNGVYNLTGQEMTLKAATAAAGGLDPLAWPTRCEIIRRLEGDREELTQWNLERILNGLDPDLYLKPNDVVRVGTHAVAPLLATIRNSFRLTYGFGFVYDRNFADMDAFGPQSNPTDRRRGTLATRFPGLFP